VNTILVVVVAGDGVTTLTYTITVTRINNDASLSGLVLSSGAMDQAFAPGTFNYTQTTNDTSLTATPTAADSNASITVNGAAVTSGSASQVIALALGINTVTVVVTATDGVGTQTYTVLVTRHSSEANLSGLVLSSGALDQSFSPDSFNYTQTTDATSLTVIPTVVDNGASVTVNGAATTSGAASSAIALTPGSNTITVVVTAEDGTTTQTYTIAVTRLNNDAGLLVLNLSSGAMDQAFASGTLNYTQTTNVISLTVTPTAIDSNASITVNGSTVTSGAASSAIALALGANTITVVVTADDGVTTQTYTIAVTRLNNVATLSSLILSSGALDQVFSSSTFSYTQTTDATSLTVTPTVTDNNSSVTVNGSAVTSGSASQAIALVTGVNTINVAVTAEDGATTQIYTVAITLPPNDNADISSLVLTTGALDQVFSPSTLNYTHTTNDTLLNLTATLSDANARVRINGALVASGTLSHAIGLSLGSNTINLVVTAADHTTTQTYTVTVTRLSTNANLSTLALSTGALDQTFSWNTLNYSQTTNATSLSVTATLSDTNASMSVNGSVVASGSASSSIALVPGSNTITVGVIAEDGSTSQSYVVTVTRLNNDASLTNLTLSGGILDQLFQSTLYDYTSTVGYLETAVAIIAEAPHGATVTVNGIASPSGAKSEMVSLDEGPNTITVTVVSEDA